MPTREIISRAKFKRLFDYVQCCDFPFDDGMPWQYANIAASFTMTLIPSKPDATLSS